MNKVDESNWQTTPLFTIIDTERWSMASDEYFSYYRHFIDGSYTDKVSVYWRHGVGVSNRKLETEGANILNKNALKQCKEELAKTKEELEGYKRSFEVLQGLTSYNEKELHACKEELAWVKESLNVHKCALLGKAYSPPAANMFLEKLKNWCEMELKVVGCTVTDYDAGYTEGYNNCAESILDMINDPKSKDTFEILETNKPSTMDWWIDAQNNMGCWADPQNASKILGKK